MSSDMSQNKYAFYVGLQNESFCDKKIAQRIFKSIIIKEKVPGLVGGNICEYFANYNESCAEYGLEKDQPY